MEEGYYHEKAITIPYRPNHHAEEQELSAPTLALAVIGWIMQDGERAERYVALTGLSPDALRSGLSDNAILASALEFLINNENDLMRAAEALALTPEELVAAYKELSS